MWELQLIALEHKILSPQGMCLEPLVCRPNASLESTFGLTIELIVNWWDITLLTLDWLQEFITTNGLSRLLLP